MEKIDEANLSNRQSFFAERTELNPPPPLLSDGIVQREELISTKTLTYSDGFVDGFKAYSEAHIPASYAFLAGAIFGPLLMAGLLLFFKSRTTIYRKEL